VVGIGWRRRVWAAAWSRFSAGDPGTGTIARHRRGPLLPASAAAAGFGFGRSSGGPVVAVVVLAVVVLLVGRWSADSRAGKWEREWTWVSLQLLVRGRLARARPGSSAPRPGRDGRIGRVFVGPTINQSISRFTFMRRI
jgi:hypothetical protein